MEERNNFFKAENEQQARNILTRLRHRGYHTTEPIDLLCITYPCSFFTNNTGQIVLDFGIVHGAPYSEFVKAWIKNYSVKEKTCREKLF